MLAKEFNTLNQTTQDTISSIETLMRLDQGFKRKEIKLSKIKISNDFEEHKPRTNKLTKKYWYYKKHGRFESPIYLDRHNNLMDGYTTYLLTKMFGIQKIYVWKEI